MREGEIGDRMFIIIEGQADVLKLNQATGQNYLIVTLG